MLHWILAAGIVIVIGLLVREILHQRAGKGVVTTKHLALRIASGLVLITILAMVIVGHGWLQAYSPFLTIGYWTLCFLLASVLVVLALFDIKQVGISYGEDRKRMFRDLANAKDEKRNGQ